MTFRKTLSGGIKTAVVTDDQRPRTCPTGRAAAIWPAVGIAVASSMATPARHFAETYHHRRVNSASQLPGGEACRR